MSDDLRGLHSAIEKVRWSEIERPLGAVKRGFLKH